MEHGTLPSAYNILKWCVDFVCRPCPPTADDIIALAWYIYVSYLCCRFSERLAFYASFFSQWRNERQHRPLCARLWPVMPCVGYHLDGSSDQDTSSTPTIDAATHMKCRVGHYLAFVINPGWALRVQYIFYFILYCSRRFHLSSSARTMLPQQARVTSSASQRCLHVQIKHTAQAQHDGYQTVRDTLQIFISQVDFRGWLSLVSTGVSFTYMPLFQKTRGM